MPFEPGQSGNPEGGRAHKRKRPITDMYTALLVQNPEKLRAFCMRMIEKAAEGDILAIKEITDRVEGKAAQSVEHTGDGLKVIIEHIGGNVSEDTLAAEAAGFMVSPRPN